MGRRWGRGCGCGRGGRLYTHRYTVTTRMTSALRWAAMRAILKFHNCEERSDKTVSTDHNLRRERRAETDSNPGPSACILGTQRSYIYWWPWWAGCCGPTAFSVAETIRHTLRASLSGTFLPTLPDLVTPLKGHSLSPRSCPPTRSAPSERFGY